MRSLCSVLLVFVSIAVADVPPDAKPFPQLDLEVGTAYALPTSVIIELDKVPTSRKLNLPRMANVVQQVRWLGETSDSTMKLHSEIAVWTIDLSDPPPNKGNFLELVLDAAPMVFIKKVVATADTDGVINLPAKFATTYGEKLRFEPQPHKNTVGYWVVEKDFAEWHFASPKPEAYDVEIFQGCGKGHGGSDIEIQIADQKVPLKILDTGHFQNFQWRSMGRIQVPAGDDVTLKLVAIRKAAGAVMDCREIRLIPVNNPDLRLRRAGKKK